jgi:hypothetical protein
MFCHWSAIFRESTNTKDHKKWSLQFILYHILISAFVGYDTEYNKMYGTSNLKYD